MIARPAGGLHRRDDAAHTRIHRAHGLNRRFHDAGGPTMSQLAKLRIITSYLPSPMSSTALSVTSMALISGFMSNVAIFGLSISTRSSPGLGSSTPPLKKNVTCAYFCVSAMRSCLRPRADRYSPSVLSDGPAC